MTRSPKSSISVDTVGGFDGKWSPKAQSGVSIASSLVPKLILLNEDLTLFTRYKNMKNIILVCK